MPVLFVITGSNGAGKSTVGYTYLPPKIQQKYTVFDGDKLTSEKVRALHLSGKPYKEAKRIAEEWINEHFLEKANSALKNNDHFAYEGHFRYETSWKILKKFQQKGYKLSLIFMGVADPHLSELRVIDRARHGGHNVPPYEIELNFYGNLEKVNKHYKIFDELLFIDTSESLKQKILLQIKESQIISYISSKELPQWFIRFLPGLFKIIKAEERSKSN